MRIARLPEMLLRSSVYTSSVVGFSRFKTIIGSLWVVLICVRYIQVL